MTAKIKGKGYCQLGYRYLLAFFLLFAYLPVCEAQEAGFPVITLLDPRDTGFRQYISDVENSRRRLAGIPEIRTRNRTEEAAEHLTIYRYTTRPGDDIFSLAARCNIPYSALASLNRLGNPAAIEAGKTLLLPSCPGLFIPAGFESELEKLLVASRLQEKNSVEIKISAAAGGEKFHFFPGEDFSPTERAFFLNSGFHFPLKNFRLTSSFGMRENPVTGNVGLHRGLDLAAPEGTEVFATADGTVTDIGTDPIYGNYIVITHSERWTSLYAHLQKFETDLRMKVKSGSLIGRVGTTGQSTGPHLHFELRQDGQALNPAGRLRP